MSGKRQILEQLKRDELSAAVTRLELTVADRRVRDQLIDALVSSPDTALIEVLSEMKRDRLKELCRELDLDDSGREKAALVGRLAGKGPAAAGNAAPPAPVRAESPTDPRTAPRVPAREDFRAARSTPFPADPPETRPRRPAPARAESPPYRPPPGGRPRRDPAKPINIQDSFLFESLKERRLLVFVLEHGRQIRGRIQRFDRYGLLVDTGTRMVLIYKHAISLVAEASSGSR